MKQLLLNFLFFVAAALVFIQCAKLFPSDEKTPKHQLLPNKTSAAAVPADNKISTNSGQKKSGFQTATFVPFIKHSSLQHRNLMKVNSEGVHYNPYLLFKDYTIAKNDRQDWQ